MFSLRFFKVPFVLQCPKHDYVIHIVVDQRRATGSGFNQTDLTIFLNYIILNVFLKEFIFYSFNIGSPGV